MCGSMGSAEASLAGPVTRSPPEDMFSADDVVVVQVKEISRRCSRFVEFHVNK